MQGLRPFYIVVVTLFVLSCNEQNQSGSVTAQRVSTEGFANLDVILIKSPCEVIYGIGFEKIGEYYIEQLRFNTDSLHQLYKSVMGYQRYLEYLDENPLLSLQADHRNQMALDLLGEFQRFSDKHKLGQQVEIIECGDSTINLRDKKYLTIQLDGIQYVADGKNALVVADLIVESSIENAKLFDSLEIYIQYDTMNLETLLFIDDELKNDALKKIFQTQ